MKLREYDQKRRFLLKKKRRNKRQNKQRTNDPKMKISFEKNDVGNYKKEDFIWKKNDVRNYKKKRRSDPFFF